MKTKAVILGLFALRELIYELVLRELRDRHRGQLIGTVWSFGHPLILMTMYVVLFAYVFPARFGEGVDFQDYSVNIIAGIISWLAFQDILARSPTILLSHSNLVKQIVFPMEVLPIKTAIASILPYSVAILFAVLYAWYNGTLTWMVVFLPLVLAFQLLAMVGAAFILSALGVFVRDLKDVVQVFCTANLFIQPILYNPFSAPDLLVTVLQLNPFSYLVWCWQDVLFHGTFYHVEAWIALPIASILILVAGWAVFHSLRSEYGDAL